MLGLITLAVCGFALILLFGKSNSTRLPAAVTFILHLITSTLFFIFNGVALPDAIYYDRIALEVARGGTEVGVTLGKEGWPQLLGLVYGTLGHSPLLGLWINAFAAAATVILMGIVASRLELNVRGTAWAFALLPEFLIWSSVLLRESLVWFLLSVMLVGLTGVASGRRVIWSGLLLAGGTAALLSVRGTLAVIILAAGIAALMFTRRSGIATVGASLLVILIPFSEPVLGRITQITGGYSLASIEASRDALTRTASTGFEVAAGGGGLSSIVSVLPEVFFGPFIWNIGAVGIPGVAMGLIWGMILLFAVVGWRQHSNKRALLVLILPAVSLLLVLALTSGNYGTLVRLRVQAEIFLVPLAVTGFLWWRNSRRESGTAIKMIQPRPDSKKALS